MHDVVSRHSISPRESDPSISRPSHHVFPVPKTPTLPVFSHGVSVWCCLAWRVLYAHNQQRTLMGSYSPHTNNEQESSHMAGQNTTRANNHQDQRSMIGRTPTFLENCSWRRKNFCLPSIIIDRESYLFFILSSHLWIFDTSSRLDRLYNITYLISFHFLHCLFNTILCVIHIVRKIFVQFNSPSIYDFAIDRNFDRNKLYIITFFLIYSWESSNIG